MSSGVNCRRCDLPKLANGRGGTKNETIRTTARERAVAAVLAQKDIFRHVSRCPVMGVGKRRLGERIRRGRLSRLRFRTEVGPGKSLVLRLPDRNVLRLRIVFVAIAFAIREFHRRLACRRTNDTSQGPRAWPPSPFSFSMFHRRRWRQPRLWSSSGSRDAARCVRARRPVHRSSARDCERRRATSRARRVDGCPWRNTAHASCTPRRPNPEGIRF